jgi:hypothetical protein
MAVENRIENKGQIRVMMVWISSIHGCSWVVICTAKLLDLLVPTRLLTCLANSGKLSKACVMSNLSGLSSRLWVK